MRKRTLLLGAAAFAAVIAVGILTVGRVVRPALVVDAARVRLGDLEVTLPATGIFETRSVEMAFEIPGRLSEVRIREGAAVARGEVLASIEAADLRGAVEQAEAAAAAARSDAARARAAVDAARAQAAAAEAALQAARAQLSGVVAGPRSPELRQAEAAVGAARLAMEDARRNLAVQEQLYRQGAVPGIQVDAARAQFEAAQAQHEQAVARLEMLKAGAPEPTVIATAEQVRQAEAALRAAQANVRQAQAVAAAAAATVEQAAAAIRSARSRAARAELRAPYDGIVTRVYLNPGAPVAPGVPVLSLVTESGWVSADVDEADIGRVKVGQRARVTADAYPGTVLTGRVVRIGGQVDLRLGTRTVRVRVELDGRPSLRAGTSVDVDIILETITGSLLIPLDAVQQDNGGANGGGPFVFVVMEEVLRRRPVELGPRSDELVIVRHGVQEGEPVVIADPAVLQEGRRVAVRLLP